MKSVVIAVSLILVLVVISFLHWWPIVLSILFLTGSLIMLIFENMGLNRMKKLDFSKFSTVAHYGWPAHARKSFIQKVRFALVRLFMMIDHALSWPVYVFYGMTEKMDGAEGMSGVAQMRLKPIQIYAAYYYLLVSIFLGILYYFHLTGLWWLQLYTIAFTASAISLLICFLVGNQDLATLFKSSPGNIFVGIVFTGLGLVLSLFIYFMLILAVRQGSHLTATVANDVFNEFFKQKSIGLLWNRQFNAIKPLYLIMDLSGLLVATTIINTVKDLRSFKREAVHIKQIVSALLLKKKYNKALTWLEGLNRSTWDSTCWNMYIATLIGLNKIDDAVENFENIHIDAKTTDYIMDLKYFNTVTIARSFDVAPSTIDSLIAKWVPVCSCDGYLFSTLVLLLLDEAAQTGKFLKAFESRQDKGSGLPFTTVIVTFTKDREHADLEKDLENAIQAGNADPFSTCIALMFQIGIRVNNNPDDLGGVQDDLNILETKAKGINKPADLTMVLSSLAGGLSALKASDALQPAYEAGLYIFNQNKPKVQEKEYKTVVDNLNM